MIDADEESRPMIHTELARWLVDDRRREIDREVRRNALVRAAREAAAAVPAAGGTSPFRPSQGSQELVRSR
jgi:hypothetical protein